MKHKLVRDKIPDIILKNNKKPLFHVAGATEYTDYLRDKLFEEVEEYREEENLEELADIVEVIHGIVINKGKTIEEFEEIRIKKVLERGSFTKKIILDDIQSE